MKKFLAVLFAIGFIFSLSACGNTETESDTATDTEQTETTPSAESGALKTEGVDFNISLAEPSAYWNPDIATMEYTTDDGENGITVWAKDSAAENSTVCIQQIKDQTYSGTAEERTQGEEFQDCTFTADAVGDYTLYHAVAREDSDGYMEEHMFVDFNGCTLSFYGCYYDFAVFCDFLEATLENLTVEPIA